MVRKAGKCGSCCCRVVDGVQAAWMRLRPFDSPLKYKRKNLFHWQNCVSGRNLCSELGGEKGTAWSSKGTELALCWVCMYLTHVNSATKTSPDTVLSTM